MPGAGNDGDARELDSLPDQHVKRREALGRARLRLGHEQQQHGDEVFPLRVLPDRRRPLACSLFDAVTKRTDEPLVTNVMADVACLGAGDADAVATRHVARDALIAILTCRAGTCARVCARFIGAERVHGRRPGHVVRQEEHGVRSRLQAGGECCRD